MTSPTDEELEELSIKSSNDLTKNVKLNIHIDEQTACFEHGFQTGYRAREAEDQWREIDPEALPANKTVMVLVKDEWNHFGDYPLYATWNGEDWWHNGNRLTDPVIAWRPLPEGPK